MSWFCNKNILSTRLLPCGHLCQGGKRRAQTGLRGSGGLLSVLGWQAFRGAGAALFGRSVEGPGRVLRLCASCPPPRSLAWGTSSSSPAASLPAVRYAPRWESSPPPDQRYSAFVCTLHMLSCVHCLGGTLKTSVQVSSCLGIPGVLCPWLSDGYCGEAGDCGYTLRKANSLWRRERGNKGQFWAHRNYSGLFSPFCC